MSDAILARAVEITKGRMGNSAEGITVARVSIGHHFVGVRLSNGNAGACAIPFGYTRSRTDGDVLAHLGRRATALLRGTLGPVGIRRCLGIATLNALASAHIGKSHAERLDDFDALEAMKVRPDENVVLVGALVPFMRALQRRQISYRVLEQDRAAIPPEHEKSFVSVEETDTVVPDADVLVVTGATLANNTLGQILSVTKKSTRVAIVGPTVPLVPEAFFEHGCHVIGGITVIDADGLLDVIATNGKGFHFFDNSALKMTLISVPATAERSTTRKMEV